ncbi:MAG: MFS transporter [Bacillota bacterium]|nr:MFS transporter [Bacillota bacterium]
MKTVTFNNRLKKNIKRNYVFTMIQNLDLTRGIWMIYLATKGMSLTQLGLLETIFHITSFLMEVPTGAIADIYGRRVSRIVGRFLSLTSVVILLLANSFVWFAISFVITALSYNMESGAGDALIYDSLKELDDESGFMRISGNKEMIYQMAGIVSFISLGDYINKVIPSEKRATILSMASMVFSFFMITIFPVVGIMGDAFGLARAFLVMAIVATVLTVVNSISLAHRVDQ